MQIHLDRKNLKHYRAFGRQIALRSLPIPRGPHAAKTRYLTAINQILAEQRKTAWDHEHHRHKGEGESWQGAALLRTTEDHYFLHSNIHLQHSYGTRSCAEANAATDAFSAQGTDLEIDELFFMGGRADLANGIAIVPGELGKRYTPCGSCRDIMYQWRREGDHATKITLLPLNDGSQIITPYNAHHPEGLQPFQAMTFTIDELLPQNDFTYPDPKGSIKKTITNGWGYIRDGRNWTTPLTQASELEALDSLKNKNALEALNRINTFMMNKLCHLYHSSEKGIQATTIVVLRAETGEYFSATSSINRRTADVHPAMDLAVGRLLGHEIQARATDAFVMSFDYERFPKLLARWQTQPQAAVMVRMPNGNARERMKKISSIRGYATDLLGRKLKAQDATFHVFIPNNVRDFNPHAHVVRQDLRTLLPNSYINPKALRMLAG